MNYAEKIGNFALRGYFKPEGAQTAEALTPVHLLAAPTLERLPLDLSQGLTLKFYQRRDAATDWPQRIAAQEWLDDEVKLFEKERLHVAFDEWEINERATKWAHLCTKMMVLEVMQDFARDRGIEPPIVEKSVTRVGAAKRLQSERWWRRQLRKTWTRQAETHLRAVGFVQKRKQLYASDWCVAFHKQRKKRNANVLKELVAVSDAGDQLSLFDIAEKSLANPALRRAELMTRIVGFERIAETAGHRARFFTLTAPAAFHRMHSSGGEVKSWNGATVRDAQAWLCKMWARSRAALKRMGALFYGFRIAEPHHDGTPHWHLLLMGTRAVLDQITRVLRAAWFSEFANELVNDKAKKARFCVKAVVRKLKADGTTTSVAGYIAKYIAKNIDGYKVGADYEADNIEATTTCERVSAWAATHHIRQFQQIGGPSVGIWRELRRLRNVVSIEKIEAAREAADAGDWEKFVAAIGGIAVGRDTQLTLWKEQTGELNQYEELRDAQTVGVQCGSNTSISSRQSFAVSASGSLSERDIQKNCTTSSSVIKSERVMTRLKCWRIAREGIGSWAPFRRPTSYLGPVSITVRDQKWSGGLRIDQHSRGKPPWPN
jgi:hypothetical protein